MIYVEKSVIILLLISKYNNYYIVKNYNYISGMGRMQVSKIEVDNNLQETAQHGSYDFPMVIYTDQFNLFEEGLIRWHWHKELQFSVCLYDEVVFFIGNQKIKLATGEGILVNSNVLHQIRPYQNNQCRMFSMVFDATFIGGTQQSLIHKKYCSPILQNVDFKFICLKPEIPWQKNILQSLEKLYEIYHQKAFGYELEMKNYLGSLWLELIKEVKVEKKRSAGEIPQDETRVKTALQYIHRYYIENISLEMIAKSANISKSECCRSFKRILKVTPFEYLMEYRVSKAAELLLNSKKSIATIAFDTGFNGISYFGKVFKTYRLCAPSEFRKRHH